jgi:ADP-heptose:LPS heptosyltransferase
LSDSAVNSGHTARASAALLNSLLRAQKPAVFFSNGIGDCILTLPTLRALSEMFAEPLTVICPRLAFDLCFHELGARHVDLTGLTPPPQRTFDYATVASEVGQVDVFINALPHDTCGLPEFRKHLAPAVSIGFGADYDIVVPKDPRAHSADLIFSLARLFNPEARMENYANPVSISPPVQDKVRVIRGAVPAWAKVLVVHADTAADKRWPVTRFIDLLDRFLAHHPKFIAWIVGMGHEELNVGHERARVVPCLGLPLDLTIGLIADADLFVGIDSCMLHAADLARVPSVGLFGPTSAREWGVKLAPHRHVQAPSMASITVEDVLIAMERLASEIVCDELSENLDESSRKDM